jgi:PE family
MMTAATADLATIGAMLDDAHAAAAPATVAVAPAAADEVSATIAHLFSEHGEAYQTVARGAAAFQEQFGQNLRASAMAYTGIEDVIASFLTPFDQFISVIQFHLSEIPYILANFPEFLTYVVAQLALAPIVFGILGLGIGLGVVLAIIQAITSLLGAV